MSSGNTETDLELTPCRRSAETYSADFGGIIVLGQHLDDEWGEGVDYHGALKHQHKAWRWTIFTDMHKGHTHICTLLQERKLKDGLQQQVKLWR